MAQQMQSVAADEQIVYMDKELGQGLLDSKYAWQSGNVGRFDNAGSMLGDAVNLGQYEDIFKQIYGKLNAGDVEGGTADLLSLAEKIKSCATLMRSRSRFWGCGWQATPGMRFGSMVCCQLH